MTYIRRAVKYFLQLYIIFSAIVGALMLAQVIPADINLAFRNGWGSVWLINAAFAIMAALYPFLGYGKRTVAAKGDPKEYWEAIDEAIENRGYIRISEKEDEIHRYHLENTVNRAARLFEDTITVTPVLGGFEAEGLVRDLARVVTSIELSINNHE